MDDTADKLTKWFKRTPGIGPLLPQGQASFPWPPVLKVTQSLFRSVEIAGNIERRFHDNKKPIPEASGDGFWSLGDWFRLTSEAIRYPSEVFGY